MMKLSIVIICLNDEKYILDCIRSIYEETNSIPFEVIVADNGSSDGSVESVRSQFPQTRVVENRANLGFGGGNNAAISVARGEYVLILNPDTIIRDRALEKLVAYADRHPEGGAFGCRVLNPGRIACNTRHNRFPPSGDILIAALCLRPTWSACQIASR